MLEGGGNSLDALSPKVSSAGVEDVAVIVSTSLADGSSSGMSEVRGELTSVVWETASLGNISTGSDGVGVGSTIAEEASGSNGPGSGFVFPCPVTRS